MHPPSPSLQQGVPAFPGSIRYLYSSLPLLSQARQSCQCQILLHLPNWFPLKYWQRCCNIITCDVLLLTLSIASTSSDAKVLKLCQILIKNLCNNPLLQKMAVRPKCAYGALITFPCPLWFTNTGKHTKLPRVTLQIFEGLPDQRKK